MKNRTVLYKDKPYTKPPGKPETKKVQSYKYRKNHRFLIVIEKTKYSLRLEKRKKGARSPVILPKSYKIGVGRNKDLKPKIKSNDNRTPEGIYFICQKAELKPGKLGTRWMRLTYPNLSDIRRAEKSGIIDSRDSVRLKKAYKDSSFKRIETPLGFGIGIHGTDKPEQIGGKYSDGCIRMHNRDIEELYSIVPVGTRVEIYH